MIFNTTVNPQIYSPKGSEIAQLFLTYKAAAKTTSLDEQKDTISIPFKRYMRIYWWGKMDAALCYDTGIFLLD